MKGYLCEKLDESQLRKLGHRLPKIWRRFKTDIADPSLDQFDSAISKLDKFERIRYPEEIVESGLRPSIAFRKAGVFVDKYSGYTEPRYELIIDELDALAKAIIEKSKFNSAAFAGRLNQDALMYLKMDNKSPIW